MFESAGVAAVRRLSVVVALALVGCAAQVDSTTSVASGSAPLQQAPQTTLQAATQPPTQPFGPASESAASFASGQENTSHLTFAKLSGGWFYGHGFNSRGRYTCSIGLTGPTDAMPMLIFDWFDGMSGVGLMLHKASWNIPAGTRPTVEVVVAGAHPFVGHAYARQQTLNLFFGFPIFDALFIETTAAGRMQIRFPGGNEPVWTITTASLPQASIFLQSCIAERRKADGTPRPSPRARPQPEPRRHITPNIPITRM